MTWARNTLVIISWWTGRPWKVNINKQATNQSSSPCFVPCPVSLSELFQKELVVLDMTVPDLQLSMADFFFIYLFQSGTQKKGNLFSTRETTFLQDRLKGSSGPREMPVVCCPWTSELISVGRPGGVSLVSLSDQEKEFLEEFSWSMTSYLEAVISGCLTSSFGEPCG